MFMNTVHIHIMLDEIKVKKTPCMQGTHSFGIRVSKHSQMNYYPIPVFYPFYLAAIEAYYVFSHHPNVSYINTSTITLSF